MGGAAVLLAAIGAVVVGLIVFGNRAGDPYWGSAGRDSLSHAACATAVSAVSAGTPRQCTADDGRGTQSRTYQSAPGPINAAWDWRTWNRRPPARAGSAAAIARCPAVCRVRRAGPSSPYAAAGAPATRRGPSSAPSGSASRDRWAGTRPAQTCRSAVGASMSLALVGRGHHAHALALRGVEARLTRAPRASRRGFSATTGNTQ